MILVCIQLINNLKEIEDFIDEKLSEKEFEEEVIEEEVM